MTIITSVSVMAEAGVMMGATLPPLAVASRTAIGPAGNGVEAQGQPFLLQQFKQGHVDVAVDGLAPGAGDHETQHPRLVPELQCRARGR